MGPMSQLAEEILSCRRCDLQSIKVRHSTTMNRGAGSEVMIVGVEPGNTELQTGEAFSGLAGHRLIEWLIRAGVGKDRSEVFQRCYLTSLCKCNVTHKRDLNRAVTNCFPFLIAQVERLEPHVCITLGLEPLQAIAGRRTSLERCVGGVWTETDFGKLFPLLPVDCKILPLPHPSPRSFWLNSTAHRQLLEVALECLGSLLRKV